MHWLVPILFGLFCFQVASAAPISRFLPDPYYPQKPKGELKLNYYYDRTGRWVKFSDWIPFKQKKYEPRFFEDYYELYGLGHHYNVAELKESIYILHSALYSRFRHPVSALCHIETEEQYARYRNLMFMHANYLIMRMYLRLGSLFDKRTLTFHDLDVADDLEISFLIAKTYYNESIKYWEEAKRYALEADQLGSEIDLPAIESERYRFVRGKTDYDRIIALHLERLESKLERTTAFLDEEGRPRPVKTAIQKDLERMYDDKFRAEPLGPPELKPHWKEIPLYGKEPPLFPDNEPWLPDIKQP